MSRFHGKDGVVSVGGTAVLEINEFTMDEESGVSRAVAMGQGYVGHATGHPARTGTVRGQYDPSDGGQDAARAALRNGNSVALTLQPEGIGSGKIDWDFAAVWITSISHGVPGEAYSTIEFSWAADSDLVETTQA